MMFDFRSGRLFSADQFLPWLFQKNVTATEADQLYDVFMEEFDDNKDGKISIREVRRYKLNKLYKGAYRQYRQLFLACCNTSGNFCCKAHSHQADTEVSSRVQVQESFFALFRNNTPPETGIDYMKVRVITWFLRCL